MAYSITKNDYFNQKNPNNSEELINLVEVTSLPVQIKDYDDEIYKSSEALPVSAGVNYHEVKFSEVPVINYTIKAYKTGSNGELTYDDNTGEITNDELTVASDDYAWGAYLTITNSISASYCVVVVGGYQLSIKGKINVQAEDYNSQVENGLIKYKYPDNHLIQKRTVAQSIADELLDIYKIARKDTTVSWRGDLALELRDEFTIPLYQKNGINVTGDFIVTKQISNYDGGFSQKTSGRRIGENVEDLYYQDTYLDQGYEIYIDYFDDEGKDEYEDTY